MAHNPGDVAVAPLDVRQVAEQLERVAAMVEAGNPRAARRELGAVTAHADEPTVALLVSCLQALERPRVVALARLRQLWKCADADGRELVEAVLPRAERLAPVGAVPAARPADKVRGPVSVASTRQGPARGSRGAAVASGARDAARYFAQDAEVGGLEAFAEEEQPGSDYPGWVDDEAPALVPASGTLCVSCWIERPVAEQRAAADDGLCSSCRERGVAGIVVASGADRAERMRARVAHIAGHATGPEQARSLLRGEWRRARGRDKRVIFDWVEAHLPA